MRKIQLRAYSGESFPVLVELAVLTLLLLLSSPIAHAREDAVAAKPRAIRFQRFSVEEGLPHSNVRTVLQDRRGFMWFGTADGPARFDGYSFTLFKHDPADPNSLGDSYIRSICEDQDGYLWIATNHGGLNRMNRETGRSINYKHDLNNTDSLSNNFVIYIYEDRSYHNKHDPDDPSSISGSIALKSTPGEGSTSTVNLLPARGKA